MTPSSGVGGVRVGDWMARASERLRAAGVPFPRRDALLLAADATGLGKEGVLAHPEKVLTPAQSAELESRIERRARREPLQYIRGFHEFWGQRVEVGPGCLVPRPETEHLVERALALLAPVVRPRVAELGPGSGCVLMALASRRPDARLVGMDISPGALLWAGRNCGGLRGVLLVRGDFARRPPLAGLHLVLANPPYVSDPEWPELPPEVRDHEPPEALRCGPDPLGPYRQVAAWAALALAPGGHLLAELGVAQARRARSLRALHPDLTWAGATRDYAGRLRVAGWVRSGS